MLPRRNTVNHPQMERIPANTPPPIRNEPTDEEIQQAPDIRIAEIDHQIAEFLETRGGPLLPHEENDDTMSSRQNLTEPDRQIYNGLFVARLLALDGIIGW